MKQTEAVDVIYSLLPRMKTEAPETVLEKYATSRGLSPAQLERLGHVFNTASTLATLEKDREAAPPLIKVQSMVSNFINSTGKAKCSSFFDQTPVESRQNRDKNVAILDLPNVWGEKRPEAVVPQQKVAHDRQPDMRRCLVQALDLAEEAVEQEVTAMSKWAAAIWQTARTISRDDDPAMKFATVRADLQGLTSEIESQMAVDKLSSDLKGLGMNVELWNSEAPPVVLSRDRTGLYGQVRQGLDHLKLAVAAHSALTQSLEVADQMTAGLTGDWHAAAEVSRRTSKIAALAEAGGIVKESFADKKKDEGGRSTDKILDSLIHPKFDNSERVPSPYVNEDLLGPLGGEAVQGGYKLFERGREGLTQGVPAYLNLFSRSGPVGQFMETEADSSRKRNESMVLNRRQIEQDTIAAAKLQKLMLTDEVLSTRDPEKVWQAYQSIRAAGPSVASDESMLKVLLRQATETQGLDIDTATAIRKFHQMTGHQIGGR